MKESINTNTPLSIKSASSAVYLFVRFVGLNQFARKNASPREDINLDQKHLGIVLGAKIFSDRFKGLIKSIVQKNVAILEKYSKRELFEKRLQRRGRHKAFSHITSKWETLRALRFVRNAGLIQSPSRVLTTITTSLYGFVGCVDRAMSDGIRQIQSTPLTSFLKCGVDGVSHGR